MRGPAAATAVNINSSEAQYHAILDVPTLRVAVSVSALTIYATFSM